MGKPRTWRGITRKRSRFDVLVNDVMAWFMRTGIEPSKKQICERLGLDYDNWGERESVTQAIHNNRNAVHYAWNLWVKSGDFDKHYQQVADNSSGFEDWKEEKAQLVTMMKRIGMTDVTVLQSWILSKLWERFLAVANQWNLHVFVAFGTPYRREGFTYKQPNYWDYVANQVETARRLCKGTITILERHRDMGMILTSGEEVEVAIRTAKDTLLMIADGAPPRYRCELCASHGVMTSFKTQTELVEHHKEVHSV